MESPSESICTSTEALDSTRTVPSAENHMQTPEIMKRGGDGRHSAVYVLRTYLGQALFHLLAEHQVTRQTGPLSLRDLLFVVE